MNPATTPQPASASNKKSRRRKPRNTSSWPVGFDKEERKMLKELQEAAGGRISIGELARASVRYAAPKFLTGEAPITERLTLRPLPTATQPGS